MRSDARSKHGKLGCERITSNSETEAHSKHDWNGLTFHQSFGDQNSRFPSKRCATDVPRPALTAARIALFERSTVRRYGRSGSESKSCNSLIMLWLRGVLGAHGKMALTTSFDNFTYCEVFSMRAYRYAQAPASGDGSLPGCSERNCSLDRHCRGGSLAQF